MCVVDVYFSKYVRVAKYKLVVERFCYIGNVEFAFLFAYFGIEKHMEQYVAQFFSDFVRFSVE